MKLRIKLASMCIALVLVIGVFVIGVLAANSVGVGINGSVSFVANDVYANIKGSITGTKDTDDITLSELNYSSTKEPSPEEIATWANKSLNFYDKSSTIKIEITITNISDERPLYVRLTGDVGVKDNVNRVLKNSNSNYTSSEVVKIEPTKTTNFTIEMNVKDTNYTVRNVGYSYALNLDNDNPAGSTQPKKISCDFTSDTVEDLIMTKTTESPLEGENVYAITSDDFTYAYLGTGEYDITEEIPSGTELELKYCISSFSIVYAIQINGEEVDYTTEETDDYIFISINHTVENDLSISFEASLCEM